MTRRRWACSLLATGLALAPAACNGGSDSVEVVFQIIEETEFAPSLGIDLSQMQRLSNGIYRQDVVVGTGPQLEWALEATIRYDGWLTDGTAFATDEDFAFVMGQSQVIVGLPEGLLGMYEGGVRRLIIPPELAYGALEHALIPPGSILVFEVELLGVG